MVEHVEPHVLIWQGADELAAAVGHEAHPARIVAVRWEAADFADGQPDLPADLEGAGRKGVGLGHAESAHVAGDEDDFDCEVLAASFGHILCQ